MINHQENRIRIASTATQFGNGYREPRISLWTVPEKWGGAFFILLVVQGVALIVLHAWRALVLATDAYIVDTVLIEILVATPMFVLAGILSMIELEVALTLSVWYEGRVRRKEAEMRAKMLREEAEVRDELRKEVWDEAFAEGQRAERERAARLTATREQGKRYPY